MTGVVGLDSAVQEVGGVQVLPVELFADQHQPGLVKEGGAVRAGPHRQSARLDLIHVPAALGPAEVQLGPEGLVEEGEGEGGLPLHELIGVALGADIDGSRRTAPQHPQAAPAGGHGVAALRAACGDQHPLVANQRKNVPVQVLWVDLAHSDYLLVIDPPGGSLLMKGAAKKGGTFL